MARWLFRLYALVCGSFASLAWANEPRLHARPSLVAEYDQIDGVTPFWVLFQLEIDKGWHTYWKNPGDSGLAPTLSWELPKGVTASEILWQPPERQPIPPLLNYGYSGTSYHLVKITPSVTHPSPDGVLRLKLLAKWLVCEEGCVPEQSSLELSVPLGQENRPSPRHKQIHELVQRASPEQLRITGVVHDNKTLRLELPLQSADELYFFSEVGGVVEPAAAQRVAAKEGRLVLELQRGLVPVPDPLTGLLEVRQGESVRHFAVTSANATAPTSGSPHTAALSLITVLTAFLGGVILNAMPCVFPILSLKALAVSRKAAQRPAESRAEGIAYTLGVLASFLIVGGVLLLARAGGQAIGWGYQMQSPLFVTVLVYLLFVIGLNLSGFFELSFAFSGGRQFTDRESLCGSFATGVLATAVATPCTAPFMATALGAALTLPTWGALTVFLALGLGLAAPFLLIAWCPGLLRWLPQPGSWMERLKQFLAFPMYIAAAWLLWVVGQQAGFDQQLAVMLGLIGVVFGIWVWPSVRPLSRAWRYLLLALLVALACFPLVTGSRTNVAPPPSTFSPDTIQRLRSSGRPVFVYATAAWCITCKVNERLVLTTAEVQTLFRERGIEVLRADWTNSDPAITSWLAGFERNGVPLYVYYPTSGEPVILPQLLTSAILRETLTEP